MTEFVDTSYIVQIKDSLGGNEWADWVGMRAFIGKQEAFELCQRRRPSKNYSYRVVKVTKEVVRRND